MQCDRFRLSDVGESMHRKEQVNLMEMVKLKVENATEEEIERAGHVFEPGETVEVLVRPSMVMEAKAARGLNVEHLGAVGGAVRR